MSSHKRFNAAVIMNQYFCMPIYNYAKCFLFFKFKIILLIFHISIDIVAGSVFLIKLNIIYITTPAHPHTPSRPTPCPTPHHPLTLPTRNLNQLHLTQLHHRHHIQSTNSNFNSGCIQFRLIPFMLENPSRGF